MKINISRERWVVIKNENMIYCGLSKNFHFNELTNIKNTAIKSYLSENKARVSFISSWHNAEELIESGTVKFIKVIENLRSQ